MDEILEGSEREEIMKKMFDDNNQLILKRDELAGATIDIGGRDIIVGFNEPAFKSSSDEVGPDLDSKLNARLVSYFLPAVEVGRMQSNRPRLILVSGINVALKWNAATESERKIMTINNNIKFDFLTTFFHKFFPDAFSVIECVVAQDPIKIGENKLLKLWQTVEQKYPEEIDEIKIQLARFRKPKLFNQNDISEKAREYLRSNDHDLLNSFKYAIAHLFALGDINFEGNIIHNPIGYLSIGGHQEKTFNKIRTYAYQLLKSSGEKFFGREVIFKDNLKLIIDSDEHAPPPYNGCYRKNGDHLVLEEVTYENNQSLDFYDTHKKLKTEMEYVYKNLIPKNDYSAFWDEYRQKYFELKTRYREAYHLIDDF